MVVLTERTLEENKQVAASKKEEVRGRDDSQSPHLQYMYYSLLCKTISVEKTDILILF